MSGCGVLLELLSQWIFSRELIKCFLGLADRRAHASRCCFVCSVVQWRQNSMVSGCTQISLKSHNSGFTCHSQKRFLLFYSSSKVFQMI